jgi:hypothetical protein
MSVALGDVEHTCQYCSSLIRFIPGSEEMEVVRTREEMKYKERVAVQQARLRQELEREEGEQWRQTAAKVAIAALPVLGRSAGSAVFRAALHRGGGCLGCGCVLPIALLAAILFVVVGLLRTGL